MCLFWTFSGIFGDFFCWPPKISVATPAEPRGEKKTFFCANFGRWKTFKIWWKKCRWNIFMLRGAKNFSNTFRIVFRIFFSRFSNRFSYRFKFFSWAVSFCRHASLTKTTLFETSLRFKGRARDSCKLLLVSGLNHRIFKGYSRPFACGFASQKIAIAEKSLLFQITKH